MLKFVFASEDDRYLLDSLLSVSLDDYLYFQERKNGFNLIYFISGESKGGYVRYSLLPADQASGGINIGKNFWGAKQLGAGCEGQTQEELYEKLSALVQNRKKEKNRICLIFDIRTFCGFFYQESNLQLLLSWIEKPERLTLVLKVPVIAEQCLDAFLAENSIFRLRIPDNSTGKRMRAISPVLYELLNQGGCLFEKMKQQMGDQCVFLNRFTRSGLARVVKRCQWIDHPERWESLQMQEDICDFLYAYYHSSKMPCAVDFLLQSNDSHNFRLLLKELDDQRIWNRMISQCRQLRGTEQGTSLLDILREKKGIVCDRTEEACVVFRENPMLLPIQAVSQKLKSAEGVNEPQRDRLLTCLTQMQKAGTCLQTQEREDWQRQCLEAVEKLDDPGQPACSQVLEITADALTFGLEHRFDFQTEEEQEKWKLHLELVKLAGNRFQLWKNICIQEQELNKCQQAMNACEADIESFEKEKGKKYLDWLGNQAALTPSAQTVYAKYTDLLGDRVIKTRTWQKKNTQLAKSKESYECIQQCMEELRNKIICYVPDLDLDEELLKMAQMYLA